MRTYPLPAPARYFPLERGVYEVAPHLRKLGSDFGNGTADFNFIQIDNHFRRYRESKLGCRNENLSKYYQRANFPAATETSVIFFLIERLVTEHPGLFSLQQNSSSGACSLFCSLTGETLYFSVTGELVKCEATFPQTQPTYVDAFDALCSQVQEDIAITQLDPPDRDWLAAGHICSPSHWAIQDKIGKSFYDVHAPIPGIEKMNRTATQLVQASISKGPYTRFVWSLVNSERLNQNSYPPPGISHEEWDSGDIDFGQPCPFYLRIERQVTWGLPAVSAFAFSIRLSFISGTEIRENPEWNQLFRTTLLGMSPASRRYKRVPQELAPLFHWFQS